MGTYTRFKCRIKLADSTPPEVITWLQHEMDFTKKVEYHDDEVVQPFNDHEFFECQRWVNLFYSHKDGGPVSFKKIGKTWILDLDAEFKNYDSEISKFVDWIMPYVKIGRNKKVYIGYKQTEGHMPQYHYWKESKNA